MMAAGLERPANSSVIIELAVYDRVDETVLACQRLIAGREVDNRKPSVPKSACGNWPTSLLILATMMAGLPSNGKLRSRGYGRALSSRLS